jgi:protein translocase SecG subunit
MFFDLCLKYFLKNKKYLELLSGYILRITFKKLELKTRICYTLHMNTITQILPWFQLALSVLLVILVLLQRSADGIEALGGSSSHVTYFSRRGAERFLFIATIVIAILFAASALMPLVLA